MHINENTRHEFDSVLQQIDYDNEDDIDGEINDIANSTVKSGILRFLKPKGGGGPSNIKTEGDSSKIEYKYLGMFIGHFLWMLRESMGDNANMKASVRLDQEEVYIFWFIWILSCIITSVIFLNFIIAEASASYSKVKETLDEVIWKERASMIYESETMSLKFRKTAE